MCGLTKKVKQNDNELTQTVYQSRAKAPRAIKGGPKPLVCAKCRTAHWSRQISCKNCGDYFHTQLPEVSIGSSASPMKIMAIAAAAAGFAGALMLHVL